MEEKKETLYKVGERVVFRIPESVKYQEGIIDEISIDPSIYYKISGKWFGKIWIAGSSIIAHLKPKPYKVGDKVLYKDGGYFSGYIFSIITIEGCDYFDPGNKSPWVPLSNICRCLMEAK